MIWFLDATIKCKFCKYKCCSNVTISLIWFFFLSLCLFLLFHFQLFDHLRKRSSYLEVIFIFTWFEGFLESGMTKALISSYFFLSEMQFHSSLYKWRESRRQEWIVWTIFVVFFGFQSVIWLNDWDWFWLYFLCWFFFFNQLIYFYISSHLFVFFSCKYNKGSI